MNKQQIEQQIDRFINNEMSLFEQEEFRRMLETDSHLKEQVKLRMILIEGELIRAEQKARLAIEASKHNIHPHSWVAVACILCIFAGIGLYVGSLHRYSPEEIYQTYYEVPIIGRARGEGISEKIAECNQKIITAYEQQQYETVTELYREKELSIKIDAFPVSTRLYIGISFIERQETTEAISVLLPLVGTPYKEEAEWLLLCCYMKINDRDKALQVVTEIKEDNGLYKEKAISIEKLLKERKWF